MHLGVEVTESSTNKQHHLSGSIGVVTYEAKKKKGKICFVIYIAGERFVFFYDVIVKQIFKKRPANQY